jgi:hypothetical protein
VVLAAEKSILTVPEFLSKMETWGYLLRSVWMMTNRSCWASATRIGRSSHRVSEDHSQIMPPKSSRYSQPQRCLRPAKETRRLTFDFKASQVLCCGSWKSPEYLPNLGGPLDWPPPPEMVPATSGHFPCVSFIVQNRDLWTTGWNNG